ncbi:chalcone isomerase family protein [Ottowia testudinis]|uniref:Chalcone isomerase family protein n=1 Tax=Ottowia testudinis TaxID=2816950 RepID=A0A975CF14_9BURK|nr:chalcone isomerase family protein [Ottowia testudinis]QTD45025.1 chalcone isomerase family protein [Ottowia testudinis]
MTTRKAPRPWRPSVRPLVAAAALFCAALVLPTPVLAVDVAGVQFPDQVNVAGKPLRLNGAGVRYKAVFKVYAAGLYVPVKTASAAEATATDAPKRLSITMLRDIESAELGKMFSRGMEENAARGSMTRLLPGIMRMSQIFSDHKKLSAGESFQVDWVPGTGAVLIIKGQAVSEPFREPEFFQTLMDIWLGAKPADWKLKEALLGKEST